jgi:hypothetical protein
MGRFIRAGAEVGLRHADLAAAGIDAAIVVGASRHAGLSFIGVAGDAKASWAGAVPSPRGGRSFGRSSLG